MIHIIRHKRRVIREALEKCDNKYLFVKVHKTGSQSINKLLPPIQPLLYGY